jgi:NitT/TauT family transport system substrate-binding protein
MRPVNRSAITQLAAYTALAGLVTAALTGCGSETAATASGEGLTKVKVAVAPIHFEPAHLAESQGYFEDHGLDVELVPGQDPAALLAMAVSGQVDIAIGSWINVATSASEGVPVSVIGGNGVVDSETDNSGVLVAADSDVKSLADLKGKTIGVMGVKSGGDIPVLQALEGAGVSPDDVKEVAVPYSGMQAAVEQKTVDAVVPADSFYHQMVEAGYRTISNPVREYQANMPVTVWTSTNEWLAGNGETAGKFVAAMEDAAEFYNDDANLAAIQEVHAKVNQIDVAKAPKAFVPVSVPINVKEAQSGIDAMEHFGLLNDPLSVEELLWEEAPRRTSADAK